MSIHTYMYNGHSLIYICQQTKCHQYWPTTGSISYNDLTITMVDQQTLAYYTIRTFIMNMVSHRCIKMITFPFCMCHFNVFKFVLQFCCILCIYTCIYIQGNDRREVKQFHYTSWPDFGVPDHPNPIISFIRRVNISNRNSKGGPDIIHCSAGVGRTGTYITIQSMLQMIEEEGRLDVFNFVMGMRHERNLMVQTEVLPFLLLTPPNCYSSPFSIRHSISSYMILQWRVFDQVTLRYLYNKYKRRSRC